MRRRLDRESAEKRFREVFAHYSAVVAYARRRGSTDAEEIAAETMSIAWRKLSDVPSDDARPWLYATARNLAWAESRRAARVAACSTEREPVVAAPEPPGLDPRLAGALRSLSRLDLEAVLLVAWEDLTPTQAARSLGINPVAFRVRLLRARRRLQARLNDGPTVDHRATPRTHPEVEGTP